MLVSEFTEYPRRVILEFEIVSCRWRQLVSDTNGQHPHITHNSHVERKLVSGSKVLVRDGSLDLRLTSRNLPSAPDLS